MVLHIAQVLSQEQLAQLRTQLLGQPWADGKVTAGTQSAQVKNNRQLPEDLPAAAPLKAVVLQALSQSAQFFSAALPRRIYPPLFNQYSGANNRFGSHVDNAIRTHASSAQHLRTDLSFTLFLSDPDEYQGGELVIEQGFAPPGIKLPAGDLILYPSDSVHRVEPVIRGQRLACCSWVESMVRENAQRMMLYELDRSILELRANYGEPPAIIALTSCYHNLLRLWASV